MRSLLTCHSPPLSVTFSIIVLVTKEDSPEFSTHLLVFMVYTLGAAHTTPGGERPQGVGHQA